MPWITEDWGLTEYGKAYDRQLKYVNSRILEEREDTLVFTEHYPVYTIGGRQGVDNHLLWSLMKCRQNGIRILKTNRGGDITYHGPGQIIVYPILHLSGKKDLHVYLRLLEQVVINGLRIIGLTASRRRNGLTGIWLKDKKIAAFGIAVKRWVAYHGFALNVNIDLKAYEGIIPCGIDRNQGSITSIKEELGHCFDLQEIQFVLGVEFLKIFDNNISL